MPKPIEEQIAELERQLQQLKNQLPDAKTIRFAPSDELPNPRVPREEIETHKGRSEAGRRAAERKQQNAESSERPERKHSKTKATVDEKPTPTTYGRTRKIGKPELVDTVQPGTAAPVEDWRDNLNNTFDMLSGLQCRSVAGILLNVFYENMDEFGEEQYGKWLGHKYEQIGDAVSICNDCSDAQTYTMHIMSIYDAIAMNGGSTEYVMELNDAIYSYFDWASDYFN